MKTERRTSRMQSDPEDSGRLIRNVRTQLVHFIYIELSMVRDLFLLIPSTLVVISLIQCSKNTEPIISYPEIDLSIDFGNPYSIVTPPEKSIYLNNDTVYVKIAMSGCGPANDFNIKFAIQSGTIMIWLKNNAPTSICMGYFEYWVKYRLPKEINKRMMRILFIGPDDVKICLD